MFTKDFGSPNKKRDNFPLDDPLKIDFTWDAFEDGVTHKMPGLY